MMTHFPTLCRYLLASRERFSVLQVIYRIDKFGDERIVGGDDKGRMLGFGEPPE
jgi:hypothetical protein